jgi:putative membrane protein
VIRDSTAPPEPPDLAQLLSPQFFDSPLPSFTFGLAALYLAGVIRLAATGRRWSAGRTVVFILGCVVAILVTGGGVERYGTEMVSVFMFQQLTLMMLVPPLLVLGSPGTLLLRAIPHRGAGRVVLRFTLTLLRSRGTAWLLHPAVTVPLFLLAFYGLYLAKLADPILQLPNGHVALEFAFLTSGLLFSAPILSNDPLPVRLSYPARVIDVTAGIALHAFFGVFLMTSPTVFLESFVGPTTALGLDPGRDQELAGGLAWSYGEGPNALLLVYILHRWFRDDTAKARAADRRADEFGDPDLESYNDYLRSLRSAPERPNDPQPPVRKELP